MLGVIEAPKIKGPLDGQYSCTNKFRKTEETCTEPSWISARWGLLAEWGR